MEWIEEEVFSLYYVAGRSQRKVEGDKSVQGAGVLVYGDFMEIAKIKKISQRWKDTWEA